MSSTRRRLIGDFMGAGLPFGLLRAAASEPDPRIAIRRQDWQPAYIELEKRGELARRAQDLRSILRNCRLCARQCGANRLKGERGICGSPSRVKVAAAHAHFGEEPPLVGRYGSGTIFFQQMQSPLRLLSELGN